MQMFSPNFFLNCREFFRRSNAVDETIVEREEKRSFVKRSFTLDNGLVRILQQTTYLLVSFVTRLKKDSCNEIDDKFARNVF